MTYTPAMYVATAGQRDFLVPFPFISRSHVEVLVNGTAAAVLEWVDGTTLRLAAPLAGGSSVVIRRNTPIDEALVEFQNGAVLTQEDLNTAVRQLLYKQQEVTALYNGALTGAQVRLAQNLGVVTNPTDVAQQLAEVVLEQDVLSTFQQRVADIDLNALAITQQALTVADVDSRLVGLQADHDSLVEVVDTLTGMDPWEGLATLITNETNERIAGDDALADTIALIGAKSADSLSFILDLSKVKVSPTESLATRLSTLAASDADALALIQTVDQARISGESALATSISSLTTTVNGNTSSISTLQSSVNGLSARYGVQLDVNGYVTGFIQNNDGQTGSFTILADKFSIVGPGASPTVPFEVSGGVVRIKDAAIGNLSVGKLTSGTLGASVTQNGDWTVGTGRIIWDNGTYMKVAGVGFGTTNQFIEWFGPKMAINACSEANAIQYLKTNGDAYFGGSLSAGTLINRGQTTVIGVGAEIVVGAFGTNGGTKSIVVSFSYSRSYRCNSGTGSIGTGGSSTIVVERDTGSGWVQIGSFTANTTTANVLVDGEPGVPDQVTYGQSGSITLTDNTAAGTMSLRARVTAQTLPTLGGTGITQQTTRQSLGLVSTE